MKIQKPRCLRCGRRWRGSPDWSAKITEDTAEVNGLVCPGCTTDSERMEVLVRRASGQTFTTDITEQGRWFKKRPNPDVTAP